MRGNIVHKYDSKRYPFPDVREYVVKGNDLDDIAWRLSARYTDDVVTTEEVKDGATGKTTTNTKKTQRLKDIPITVIDDMVEQYYPNISSVPSGIKDNDTSPAIASNVWLDASHKIEKILNQIGHKVTY